ncbi:MAG TPA: hypothetical protein VJ824_08350 [Bacillota bacterium]|nr:hypothetical protein [Bacillota bacterium]
MNFLYYSLDDGSKAFHKMKHLLDGDPFFLQTDLTPGKVIPIGQIGTDLIFISGVGKSEAICRMAWAHALSQNGKSLSDWTFIRVDE